MDRHPDDDTPPTDGGQPPADGDMQRAEGERSDDRDRRATSGRIDAFRRDRPELYAYRHVAKAVIEVLLAVLGVGALLRALLPRVDLDWLRDLRDRIDLPSIPDPLSWLVGRLIGWLPDFTVPDWIVSVVRSGRWWGPILIAIFVTLNEVQKRRQGNDDDQAEPDADHGRDRPDGGIRDEEATS